MIGRVARLHADSWTATAVIGCLLCVGCTGRLDPNEYGQIVHELPKVEGADKPYPLPQLEDPAEKAAKANK